MARSNYIIIKINCNLSNIFRMYLITFVEGLYSSVSLENGPGTVLHLLTISHLVNSKPVVSIANRSFPVCSDFKHRLFNLLIGVLRCMSASLNAYSATWWGRLRF